MFSEVNNKKEGLVHYGFPEIGQLPVIIASVHRRATYVGNDENGDPIYNAELEKPVLSFTGTTKLHGTNGGIVIDFHNEVIYFESRDSILTIHDDNSGFANTMSKFQSEFVDMVKNTLSLDGINWENNVLVIFGEWCGGGIQKGVALNQLGRMFVVFNAVVRTREKVESRNVVWFDKQIISKLNLPEHNVLNIYDFPTWEIEIDFNKHHEKASIIAELTKQVEDECPFAKKLGVSGTGEGIVWVCTTAPYNTCDFWFKSKGDKHTKVKKAKSDIPVDDEKVAKLMNVADKITPNWRLEQMFNETFQTAKGGVITRTKLGDYIKSVNADIDKEEKITLEQEGVIFKDVANYVSKITRDYFFAMEKDFLENQPTA